MVSQRRNHGRERESERKKRQNRKSLAIELPSRSSTVSKGGNDVSYNNNGIHISQPRSCYRAICDDDDDGGGGFSFIVFQTKWQNSMAAIVSSCGKVVPDRILQMM